MKSSGLLTSEAFGILDINVSFFSNSKFDQIKTGDKGLLKEYHYYLKRLKACLKVLSMIYYCLFLIATTLAAVSLMFYACLKRQGYLLTVMHVLWNVIRFFLFFLIIVQAFYNIYDLKAF